MIDSKFLREHSLEVKENVKRRYKPDALKYIDEFLKFDREWRKEKQHNDDLRARRNKISQEISIAKKAKKDASVLLKEAAEAPQKLTESDARITELYGRMNDCLLHIPNLLHGSVPIGNDESSNVECKKVGKPKKSSFELLSHSELTEHLGISDFEQGRIVAGQGFNYICGPLALLDLALQRYGIDFLLQRGFTVIVPPMMLNRETLSGAVDLSAFSEVIYKVDGEDLFLIGTAEHSLVSMMKGKTIHKNELPLKFCAVTPCFRKEIGGHGVDMKGLFRMHQFNKVEQVVYSTQENSFAVLEEMQTITEEFFKSLDIPFRVIEICSGDLGAKFAKQYDLEAWFPRQKSYREVTSAGNCTDYQSRRLNIQYQAGNEKKYVHILNNTMVATSRAMVAILENFQTKDRSVTVPKVLVPYMNGITVIKKE